MDKRTEKLNDTLIRMGVSLTEDMIKKLLMYYELLIERNRVMNLTAITEFEDVIIKHFADSLAPLSIECLAKSFTKPNCSLLDLGTGAGFPGLTLAIALPETTVTLADSLNKRTNFLEDVKNNLKLDNINVVNGRAEDLGKTSDYREKFDIVVSRAVADYRILCEYCLPFIKKGGIFAAWKGPAAAEETENAKNALQILGGTEPDKKTYVLPITHEKRIILVSYKKEMTPEKYPRKAGIPSKRPL